MVSDVSEMKIKIVALVAWADGDVDEHERDMFYDVLNNSPIADARKESLAEYLKDPPLREDVIRDLSEAPPEITTTVLKIGYLVAQANDEFHENEEQLFDDLGKGLLLSEDQLPAFHEMLETYYESYQLADQLFH
jgi:uncharacterized membrane protein YebE (DUF533 family)